MSYSRNKRDGQTNATAVKYVCGRKDLDKFLDGDLKLEFQTLFYDSPEGKVQNPDAWRMFRDGMNPEEFLFSLGIDFSHPRVRDAVAFDLVKLDDDTVSNWKQYTFMERITNSPQEYERMVLNRNYRVNLVNLEDEWVKITYTDEDSGWVTKRKRTVDRVWQGLRLSEHVLGYFSSVFNTAFDEDTGDIKKDVDVSRDVYLPKMSWLDVTNEIALIPNARGGLDPTTAREYYDERYDEYLEALKRNGILMISSFARVDPYLDKTHTGEYLVKAQKWFPNGKYGYIVARIDRDGNFGTREDGSVDIRLSSSFDNTILCVCEDDYLTERVVDEFAPTWFPYIDDVPMVTSTTSSEYSVFEQMVPDHDLKYVRNYNQFYNRRIGMEFFLEEIDRCLRWKRIQLSQCFVKQTLSIHRMFREFARNRALLELVVKYYDYLSQYDTLYMKRAQLQLVIDEKQGILNQLLDEYNSMDNTRLGEKFDLGQKIKSVKLELDNSLKLGIKYLDDQLQKIRDAVNELNRKVSEIEGEQTILNKQDMDKILQQLGETFDRGDSESAFNKVMADLNVKIAEVKAEFQNYFQTGSRGMKLLEDLDVSDQDVEDSLYLVMDYRGDAVGSNLFEGAGKDGRLGVLQNVDTTRFMELIRETEKWRDLIFQTRYELGYLYGIQGICEDNTVKVRRLLKNFRERMEDIEKQVWTDKHQLRDNFSFTGIAAAGIFDIILLHDWYACNAPRKTYTEMGFKSEKEFMDFRRRCNKIAYNLRKNQYLQMLEIDRSRLQQSIQDMRMRLLGKDVLEYHDKYGERPPEDDGWDISKVTAAQERRIRLFMKASRYLESRAKEDKLYQEDEKMMRKRTVNYLKTAGLIEDESELEKLATRNRVENYEYDGDAFDKVREIEDAKDELDRAKETLVRQRDALVLILDSIKQAEGKIRKLMDENRSIVQTCSIEKDRLIKNRLLLRKLDNESKIADLRDVIESTRASHEHDMNALDSMVSELDLTQKRYDSLVNEFKTKIGVNEDTIEQIVIGIYNKFQNEILEQDGEK